ncbi:hypothetical protein HYE82_14375 [Streptomyces sp. BR123]|uniref:hypothetical protein n=1 Tax=Streptomyces sp. BR123 TaxID=2749828 RepID=UPI0015C41D1B|nr:hypothetical protein [Streptomyces sp. BR123]NXY95552.1 hypothetical protein [Streptomyces sp. BR123]
MAAWHYFAGAGLVAVCCPLHGQVAVADGGHAARAEARADVCVPEGPPRAPAVRPPVVRPPQGRPTVHHPGQGPVPAAAAPEPPVVVARAAAAAGSPAAKALAAAAEPPPAAPDPAAAAGPPAASTGAPPARGAGVARVTAFHVRPYRSRALDRREPGGLSTVMIMAVVTTPAVLAAAALRPRSKSRSNP